jgi:mannose/fructose/N-acetylgalactosamine-specific phosphotransferase system component IIB
MDWLGCMQVSSEWLSGVKLIEIVVVDDEVSFKQ